MKPSEICILCIAIAVAAGCTSLSYKTYSHHDDIERLEAQVKEMREELDFMKRHAKWVEDHGKKVVWWPF